MNMTIHNCIEKIDNRYSNRLLALFIVLMSISLFISVIVLLLTQGKSLYYVLLEDRHDTFMDYFNSIMYSSDYPYTKWSVIYPPLVTLFYAIIGYFTIPFVSDTTSVLSFALRNTQMGMMSFIFITVICVFALGIIFEKIQIDKNSNANKIVFFLFLLSYPFIFAIERGNSIIIALIFCLLFVMNYNSENKTIRYLSYVCLGIAAGIKLFPAILGLLIIKSNKRKEVIHCIIIGSLIVLLPFIFTDGNVLILLNTVTSYTGSVYSREGTINITGIAYELLKSYCPATIIEIIGNAITILLLLFTIVLPLLIEQNKTNQWKLVALISCMLVIGPGTGAIYQLIYMTMPLLLFFNTEKSITNKNVAYLILFCAILCTTPALFNTPYVSMYIRAIVVLIMQIAIIIDLVNQLYKDHNKNDTTLDVNENH